MRPFAAVALALSCACAGGYTQGQFLQGDGGGPPIGIGGGGTGGQDAGDGGQDAGDAGQDAGCVETFNTAGYAAFDNCLGFSTTTANITSTNCDATISFGTTQACTGTLSGGSRDAFDGGCGALACSAPSLPGRITCAGGCQINICATDAGVCGP